MKMTPPMTTSAAAAVIDQLPSTGSFEVLTG